MEVFNYRLTAVSNSSCVPVRYKSLDIGHGAIPVAVGLKARSIYGRESSAWSTVVMAVASVAGIVLTWSTRAPFKSALAGRGQLQ